MCFRGFHMVCLLIKWSCRSKDLWSLTIYAGAVYTAQVFPIIGGRKIEHLQSNISALSLRLTQDHIKELETLAPFQPGFPYDFVRSFPLVVSAMPEVYADLDDWQTSQKMYQVRKRYGLRRAYPLLLQISGAICNCETLWGKLSHKEARFYQVLFCIPVQMITHWCFASLSWVWQAIKPAEKVSQQWNQENLPDCESPVLTAGWLKPILRMKVQSSEPLGFVFML